MRNMEPLNANTVDPDQVPHFRRLIWVYIVCQYPFYGTLRHTLVKTLITCVLVRENKD